MIYSSGQQPFSVKAEIVNTLGSMGHMGSLTTSQLLFYQENSHR